jgi:hypothetical protein
LSQDTVISPVDGKPIPFKAVPIEDTGAKQGNPPTGVADCLRIGGHGGPKGKRVYYPSGPKLGPLLDEKLICEICGTVDV